jgi:hypothetical protein
MIVCSEEPGAIHHLASALCTESIGLRAAAPSRLCDLSDLHTLVTDTDRRCSRSRLPRARTAAEATKSSPRRLRLVPIDGPWSRSIHSLAAPSLRSWSDGEVVIGGGRTACPLTAFRPCSVLQRIARAQWDFHRMGYLQHRPSRRTTGVDVNVRSRPQRCPKRSALDETGIMMRYNSSYEAAASFVWGPSLAGEPAETIPRAGDQCRGLAALLREARGPLPGSRLSLRLGPAMTLAGAGAPGSSGLEPSR